jgi:hypothetical protein
MKRHFSTAGRVLGLALGLVLLAGCATSNVTTDYNPEYDFRLLRTFSMLPSEQTLETQAIVSKLNLERIQVAIEQELSQRYQPVENLADAHFLVRYHVIVKDKVDVRTYDSFYGGRRYYGASVQSVDVKSYTQGTLVVDILDAKTKDHIWRGSTHSRVTAKLKPEEKMVRLREAVAEVLKEFPPYLVTR